MNEPRAAAPSTATAAGPLHLPETERGLVVFLFAPSLPWNVRMAASAALAALGLGLQGATGKALPGALLLLAATAFLIVRGVHNRPDPAAFKPSADWSPAPLERLDDLLALDRRMHEWDSSFIDVTNPAGFLSFLLLAAAAWWLMNASDPWLSLLGLDAFALLSPHWFSGWRRIEDRPRLVKKAQTLRAVLEGAGKPADGDRFELLALIGRGGIPDDLKLRVAHRAAKDGYYGVQGQCVLNTVKGESYPYFYCCVVAREGFGLAPWFDRYTPPEGAVKEWKIQAGAEVIVIRQHTTRTSGYHTPPDIAARLFHSAYRLSRAIVEG